MERVKEDSDDSDSDVEIISKGKKKSLEAKKSGIVKTLLGMNSQMRDFTHDIEARLEGAYKQGASKKFGYEDIT